MALRRLRLLNFNKSTMFDNTAASTNKNQSARKRFNILLPLIMLYVLRQFHAHAQGDLTIEARRMSQMPSILYESSGIAITQPNKIWSHNDSGHTNQLFCIDTTGTLLRTITITNAVNVDWEDLAMDPQGRVFINDAGNNNNNRTDLKVYIIQNPDQIEDTTTEAEIIEFTFQDQKAFPPPIANRNFDIEGMVWKNEHLYLFTKNRSNPQNGYCKLYRLPAAAGVYTATLLDSIYLGSTNIAARVTAADINHITGELALLTGNRIITFSNYTDDRFFEGQQHDYYFSSAMGQIEALAYYDSRKLYMTEEGSATNPGYLYDINLDLIEDLHESQFALSFHIYPNPSRGLFTIASSDSKQVTVKVFTTNGLLIRQILHDGTATLDLSGLAAGTYTLHIEGEGRGLYRRIIKL
jgi:hypothetical protein